MKRVIVAMALLALFSVSAARANVPPPRPPQPGVIAPGSRDAKLIVRKDDNAKEARLVIPAGLLTAPKPRGFGAAGGLPAIMAGMALTAAMVSCGFWLVRKNRAVAAVALVASLLVFGTSAVQADLAVRPPPPALPVVTLPATVQLEGKLTLVVAPQGDTIELIVPSKMVVDAKPADQPK